MMGRIVSAITKHSSALYVGMAKVHCLLRRFSFPGLPLSTRCVTEEEENDYEEDDDEKMENRL